MNTSTSDRVDVVIHEIATGKIVSIIGEDMRRFDGEGTGRNTAELRQQTGMEKCNERYTASMVRPGKFKEGDYIQAGDIIA